MLIKQCQFAGRDDQGEYFHVIQPGQYNDHLIKVAQASPPQLDHIRQFAHDQLPKDPDVLYALVSAMGASEFWGSNSNSDIFYLDALLHTPPGWDAMPYEVQKVEGRKWEWGYPTFYNAHAFQHHRNKDPNRAFGDIAYTRWDDFMKRVLLIVGFSRSRAAAHGAGRVFERIEAGEFLSVSMGCRLLWDACSICTDWERIRPFGNNPRAILAEHNRRPIRGISTDPKYYCEHIKFQRNKILPDGKKVGMLNTHPRFFDLSVVFIGADKTSFVLSKLAGECPIQPGRKACKGCDYDCYPLSTHVHEAWSKITS